MNNSDWPLGRQNGIRPFIEITWKRQLSKSTLIFADSKSSAISGNDKWFLYQGLSQWDHNGSNVAIGRKTRAIFLFPYNNGTLPMKGCFFDIVANTFNWDVTLWIYMFWSLIFWSWRDHSGWFRNGSGCFLTLWQGKKVWPSISWPIWFLDLSKILSWSFFAVRLSLFVVMMKVVSLRCDHTNRDYFFY